MLTLSEYKYPQAKKEFIEAYLLQAWIDQKKEQIKKEQAKLDKLLQELGNEQDTTFSVTDLRKVRKVNVAFIKEQYPAVYRKLLNISFTDRGRILSTGKTTDQIIGECMIINPEETQRKASISITDLERELGKKAVADMEGTGGVNVIMSASANTRIIIKNPELVNEPKWAELIEGGEYGDEE